MEQSERLNHLELDLSSPPTRLYRFGDVLVARVFGTTDFREVRDLYVAMTGATAETNPAQQTSRTALVIDLSEVDSLDTAGAGSLVAWMRYSPTTPGPRPALVVRGVRALNTLNAAGLDRLFTVYSDLESALEVAGGNQSSGSA